ncbi:unnamed protein product, partial [Urochloa humidicola]
ERKKKGRRRCFWISGRRSSPGRRSPWKSSLSPSPSSLPPNPPLTRPPSLVSVRAPLATPCLLPSVPAAAQVQDSAPSLTVHIVAPSRRLCSPSSSSSASPSSFSDASTSHRAETLTLAIAAAAKASSNVSTVYISVIDDVISKVREDFITYGVGDAVLNELQALWEVKMVHCGAISGNIDRTKAASAGGTAGTTPPVHDLNVPYEATSEEYATPTADMLFPPTPLQTPIQTPLPGTDAGMYNIPTGPSDYAPSPISDVRNGMLVNGADPKTGRPSPYMPPPSPWMNQRPLGVDVNVAYVEGREDPDRGVQPQPLTQDFLMMSSGKRKRDEYPGQLPSGSFVPQQDGSADQIVEFTVSK